MDEIECHNTAVEACQNMLRHDAIEYAKMGFQGTFDILEQEATALEVLKKERPGV